MKNKNTAFHRGKQEVLVDLSGDDISTESSVGLLEKPERKTNSSNTSVSIYRTKRILSVYEQMAGFLNQRTIHSSRVLISELPITWYCALN